jgi:hypothetical protein
MRRLKPVFANPVNGVGANPVEDHQGSNFVIEIP